MTGPSVISVMTERTDVSENRASTAVALKSVKNPDSIIDRLSENFTLYDKV